MLGGPWDSTLIMMGVLSLKMGVPSFCKNKSRYTRLKGNDQTCFISSPQQVSQNTKSSTYLNHLYRPKHLDRNFRSFFGAGFLDDSDFSDS